MHVAPAALHGMSVTGRHAHVRIATVERHWQSLFTRMAAAGVHKGSPWLQLLDNRDPPAAQQQQQQQQQQQPGYVKPQPDPATGALLAGSIHQAACCGCRRIDMFPSSHPTCLLH
jgi:hypothetical protein